MKNLLLIFSVLLSTSLSAFNIMINPKSAVDSGFINPTSGDTAYLVDNVSYIDSKESFYDALFGPPSSYLGITHTITLANVLGSVVVEAPQGAIFGLEATGVSIIIENQAEGTFHLYSEIGAYPMDGQVFDETLFGGTLENRNADFSIIPEPSTYALILGGLVLGFVAYGRK